MGQGYLVQKSDDLVLVGVFTHRRVGLAGGVLDGVQKLIASGAYGDGTREIHTASRKGRTRRKGLRGLSDSGLWEAHTARRTSTNDFLGTKKEVRVPVSFFYLAKVGGC